MSFDLFDLAAKIIIETLHVLWVLDQLLSFLLYNTFYFNLFLDVLQN